MQRSKLENKFAQEDRDERMQFIRAAMTHHAGRKFLWWLLQIGEAIGSQPFVPNALTMSFNCGKVQVGNQILSEIVDAVNDGFAKLMVEMQAEVRERHERLAEANEDDIRGD